MSYRSSGPTPCSVFRGALWAGLYGALAGRTDFRVVNAKHETGAVFLAMGHAMATGRPGVVITTSGPGITNAITGLASAYYEAIPLVVLCGEVATSAFGRGALQEGSQAGLDTLTMVRSITKLARQLTRADSGAVLLRDALISATSERRGPVLLSLPLDVLAGEVAEAAPLCGVRHTSFDISAAGCRRAMELLATASRPLVLAGAGARAPASRAALRRLIEATGAAVAVTPKGKGVFPEDHARYLGVFGFGGHESVIDHLAEGADVIVVCGSGLDDFSTNAWSPMLNATTALIQIDTDAAQLGKNYPIDLGLLGPMDAIIDQMLAGGPVPTTQPRPARGVVTQQLRCSPSRMLTTAEVVLTLNDCCPPETVFTADMGEHLSVALHYLKVPAEGDFITCLGLGSMGSGVVSAIGYQMGAPSRRVYSICGDGCFLMYGSELVTAVQHHVPVTIVVINDSRLNMCEHGIRAQYGATTDMTTPVVDFAGDCRQHGRDRRRGAHPPRAR